MSYLPGETIRVTLLGKVAKVVDDQDSWPEVHVDVEDDCGGVTLHIPLCWRDVQIERITPADGRPKVNEVWQDRNGRLLHVVDEGVGRLRFIAGDGTSYDIERVNRERGPLVRVWQPSVDEEVPW
ncbi:hypothetical protein ABT294_00855 [Nonomuraea sp. NPDC000554]|uniref:hypothetical protein n=1 Tax=Nonomuraea sp. NPDC000554 TaxID=3154259 RepID=UPI00332FA1AC